MSVKNEWNSFYSLRDYCRFDREYLVKETRDLNKGQIVTEMHLGHRTQCVVQLKGSKTNPAGGPDGIQTT